MTDALQSYRETVAAKHMGRGLASVLMVICFALGAVFGSVFMPWVWQ